jgi:ferrous-iron efflux pump FieF
MNRASLTSSAALASAAVAMALLILKAFAATKTGSVAMLGSLADTGLDLIASLVTLWGVRLAAQPADNEHRFGHGKAEALSALFQVFIIGLSGVAIFARAVQQLLAGQPTANAEYGIVISLIAVGATVALLFYQRFVIARTGSVAIGADHVHYQSDVLLNIAVIAALAIDQFGGVKGADAIFGIAIALWLIYGAWRASSQAIDQLMDREWPTERRAAFMKVAEQHPELVGIHDLRTRTSGTLDFVQFHVWMDPKITLDEAHRIMDEVEEKLMLTFPGTEILIHPDPEGHVDHPVLAADPLAATIH